jgi:hypothetical protein
VENGLMRGTSKTTFAPHTVIARGMIIAILWRLEGIPIVRSPMDYGDVKPEDWCGERFAGLTAPAWPPAMAMEHSVQMIPLP